MQQKATAFTLIELLVTIVIIGILSSSSVVVYKNYIAESKEAKATAEKADACNHSVAVCIASGINDCQTFENCIVSSDSIPNSTKADITDTIFQNIIATKVGKPWGDITNNDLEALTGELSIWFENVSSIVGVSAMPNLDQLTIAGSSITTIPAEIGNLTKLTRLYIRYNNISTIPSEIGNLTNLTYLGLSQNHINTISSGIGNLINLNTVYLSNNNLTSIPNDISNIGSSSSWVYLNIGSNPNLTSFPSGPGGANGIQIIRYNTPLICANILASGWEHCQ